MDVVIRRIYLLLKDKEETTQGALANVWLGKEAASPEAIGQDGTFRHDYI